MPEPNLASEIFLLMAKHCASDRDGLTAMYEALIISLVSRHVNKQAALDIFSRCWDRMAPTIETQMEEYDGR
jgi:hypothetical protein